MITCTVLYPAYGRRYANLGEALADWNAGKDFQYGYGGPYCSNREVDIYENALDTYRFYTAQGIL